MGTKELEASAGDSKHQSTITLKYSFFSILSVHVNLRQLSFKILHSCLALGLHNTRLIFRLTGVKLGTPASSSILECRVFFLTPEKYEEPTCHWPMDFTRLSSTYAPVRNYKKNISFRT